MFMREARERGRKGRKMVGRGMRYMVPAGEREAEYNVVGRMVSWAFKW